MDGTAVAAMTRDKREDKRGELGHYKNIFGHDASNVFFKMDVFFCYLIWTHVHTRYID